MLCFKNISAFILVFIFFSCKNKVQYKSPAGYEILTPEKFEMEKELNEISGIVLLNGNDDTTFAIEDEKGKLYSFSFGKQKFTYSKFGKKGDYEDLALINNKTIAVLRSDGSLFLFPLTEIGKEKMDSVHEFENLLPTGEYEGLCAVDEKLFALCKNCPVDKGEKEVSVYTMEQSAGSQLHVTGIVKIDLSMIQTDEGKGKLKFHPSCIAKHPVTHQWYIISSVNKMLLVLDEQWKVKEYYLLDPAVFKQPEGLAFNNSGDMYISNEGGEGVANILLFRYHKN